MGFGSKLKLYRDNRKLTQKEVAAAIGIKRTTYNSYENSKSMPKYDVMEKIARFYELSLKSYSEEEKPKSMTELVLNSPPVEYEVPGRSKEMEDLTNDEKILVRYFRTLEGPKKEAFFEQVKNEYIDYIVKRLESEI